MRSTVPHSSGRRPLLPGAGGPAANPIRCGLVVVESLLVAGVVVLPLPALVMGVRGVADHPGLAVDHRTSFAVLVTLRALALLLVFALSGVVLLVAIGAMIRDLEPPTLVYT